MRKSKYTKNNIIIAVILSTLVLLTIVYLSFCLYFQSHFYFGTVINDIDCSGMSISDVEEELESTARLYVLKLLERNDKTENISAADVNMTISIDEDIQAIKDKQNPYSWLFSKNKDFTINTTINYDKDKLLARIDTLDATSEDYQTPAVGDSIEYSENDNKYVFVEGNAGTLIDKKILTDTIISAVEAHKSYINLEYAGCYTSIYEKSESLETLLTKLNKYVSTSLSISLDDTTLSINYNNVHKWITLDGSNVSIDLKAINEYVTNLANTYNTIGKTRSFNSSYTETDLNITGGNYGYAVDIVKTSELIYSCILNGDTKTINPIFTKESINDVYVSLNNDIGNTYLEINLLYQEIKYYESGSLIFTFPVVSGQNNSAAETPFGVYYVKDKSIADDYKFLDFYIKKDNSMLSINDSGDYVVFGSNVYTNNGTDDGSISLSISDMEQLFNKVQLNTPIIIYEYK